MPSTNHRALRRERNKYFDTTVIKMGLRQFCKDPGMIDMIERAVVTCSQVSWEASLFASFHVLRCLEDNIVIPPLDQTFFERCISTIANGRNGPSKNVPQELKESFERFRALRPDEYVYVEREPFMCHMFQQYAVTVLTNFKTVFAQTFYSRLCRWLRLKILESDRDTIKQGNKIKSAVALLCSACTDESIDIEASLPRYTRLRDVLDAGDKTWMTDLVQEVRRSIGPLPLDMSDPEKYFAFQRRILGDIENHIRTAQETDTPSFRGMKTFSILPQKKFRAPFIDITNTILRDMVISMRNNIDPESEDTSLYDLILDFDVEQIWKEFFNVKKVAKGRKSFAGSIKTDGISVSVTVQVPRAVPLPSRGIARKRALQEAERETIAWCKNRVLQQCQTNGLPDRVVAIDPGCNAPFTGVIHDPRAAETIRGRSDDADRVRFETLQWSAAKYRDERGTAYRNCQMKQWTKVCPDIKSYNDTALTAKSASLDTYSNRISHVLRNLPLLLDFYVHKRRVRRCRWYTYMRHQQSVEKMVADITGAKKHDEQREVLVAYGNATFNNVRGTQPVLQQGLRRKLRKRCLFVDIDEFRTSKLCCCCGQPMRGKVMRNNKRSYKVRHCESSACHRTYWNRDVNASINILFKLLRFVDGVDEPLEFRRTTEIEDEDEDEAVSSGTET